VTNPRETLALLGDFIEHDLDYDRIQKAWIGSVSQPNSSFSDEKAEFSPAGRWKSGYTDKNLRTFEGLVGGTLEATGYELGSGEFSKLNTPSLKRMRATYQKYFDAKLYLKAKTPLGQFLVTRDLSWI
jgi:hypothetical protein